MISAICLTHPFSLTDHSPSWLGNKVLSVVQVAELFNHWDRLWDDGEKANLQLVDVFDIGNLSVKSCETTNRV